MASPPQDYLTINRSNWDERAPEHALSPSYARARLLSDPTHLSDVVTFDVPLLGPVTGLRVLHLQCHIGTDTLSLARRGAALVVGLDFSPASLAQARGLAARAGGGERVRFVEGDVYSAPKVLGEEVRGEIGGEEGFDLVFTGVGALCWLPDIKRWAGTVAGCLRRGGRLFLREGHPMLWALDEGERGLVVGFPYFETGEGTVYESEGTYVRLDGEGRVFENKRTVEWNHGLGEIVQALLEAGMRVTGLVEHRSIPWEALPGKMTELGNGEWVLREHPERLPLSYTLQAVKE